MTNPGFFHHPDFCPTLLRRRATEAFVDMLALYGELLLTRGPTMVWCGCFPSRTAHYGAIARLKRAGVLSFSRRKDGRRILRLERQRPPVDPGRFWAKRWDGIWRLLTYDIREQDKGFRNSLAQLLRRMRLGCLQRSVWVSPHDIRAEYDDLARITRIDFDSYLFEARTVLGRDRMDVVRDAWNMDRLNAQYRWYIDTCGARAQSLREGSLERSDVERLAAEEALAYKDLLETDPLLPRSLHPSGYLGEDAHAQHVAFASLVRSSLRQSTLNGML